MHQLRFAGRIVLTMVCIGTVAVVFAAAPDAKIQPGQWRSTDTVIELSNSTMSADLIARRKSKPAVLEYCVRSDDIAAMLGVGSDKMGLCSGAINIAGGKISILRNCMTGLGKGTRKIEGTYTMTRVDTLREVTQDMPSGAPSHSKTHVVSERIGECPR